MLADRNVVSGRECVHVELEKGLIALVVVAVVEAPAMTDMRQQAVLVALAAPETANAAMLLGAAPLQRIDMPAQRQRRDKLIAVLRTPLRKFRRAAELELYPRQTRHT